MRCESYSTALPGRTLRLRGRDWVCWQGAKDPGQSFFRIALRKCSKVRNRMAKDLSPVPFPNGKGCLLNEQRRIVAYLDGVQARLSSLRELQTETQEELDALLPSVLDREFKGENS